MILLHIFPVFSLDSQHVPMHFPHDFPIFPMKKSPMPPPKSPRASASGVDGLAGPQQGSHQGLLRRRHQCALARPFTGFWGIDGNPMGDTLLVNSLRSGKSPWKKSVNQRTLAIVQEQTVLNDVGQRLQRDTFCVFLFFVGKLEGWLNGWWC